VSAASGLVLSLAFPPAELWPLAFVALAPLLWLLRTARPGRGFLLGFVFGVAFFGATLYWIFLFGALAWTALTALSALSIGIVGALAPAVVEPGRVVRSVLGMAALWTVVDWARGRVPLGGFTWGGLGISQVDDRVLLPLATLTGVWGITFVVVVVNGLLVEAVAGGGGVGRRIGTACAALALVLGPVLVPFATASGGTLVVAVVQVDVRTPPGLTAAQEDVVVARRNTELHATLASGERPDLVLWGEGALDPGATQDPATMDAVRRTVADVGVPTGIGAVIDDADGRQRTSELILDAAGTVVDRYDKVHLVPFGEYVPWRSELDWISATHQIAVDRAPGESIHTVDAPGVPPFGTPICYENSFPDLPRDFVRDGATFLVVPVNNASYGFTAASDQHLQMSRMRAVETGRWVVDAAVSGVSAFIDPGGKVISRTDLFRSEVLRGTIATSTDMTAYVRWGDWFVLVATVTLVVLFLRPPRPGRPADLRRARHDRARDRGAARAPGGTRRVGGG
jgi:apolipoprotein N-acyltransferase